MEQIQAVSKMDLVPSESQTWIFHERSVSTDGLVVSSLCIG